MRFISYFFYLALLNFIGCSSVWAVQKTQKKHDPEATAIVHEFTRVSNYGGTDPVSTYKIPEGLSALKQPSELEEVLIRNADNSTTKPTCCSKVFVAVGAVSVAGMGIATVVCFGVLAYNWLVANGLV